MLRVDEITKGINVDGEHQRTMDFFQLINQGRKEAKDVKKAQSVRY
jgi:hypothetical protein